MDHACNELKFSPKRKDEREDENGGGVLLALRGFICREDALGAWC
jgi:hypothetical protein